MAAPRALPPRGVAAIALAAVVPTVDGTISVVAVPTITREFHASFSAEQLLLNAAPLLLSLLLVPAGLAADQFGRLRLLRIGLLSVAAGAALAGTATSMAMLVAGRGLAGFGGACLLPATIALVRERSPKAPARTRRFGLLAGWAGLAAALAPLLGGLLLDAGSWRYVFAVPAALAALALVGAGHLADDAERRRAASVLHDAATAVRERQISRNCVVGNALTFWLYFGLLGLSYLLVAGGQAALGWSATTAALSVLPLALALWAGAEPFGAAVHRFGTRALCLAATVCAAGGLALIGYALQPTASWWSLAPGTILFGVGLAAAAAPLTHASVTSMPAALSGVASGLHHAVVRAAGVAATVCLGNVAARAGAAPTADGLTEAMLACAAIVAFGGLAAVAALDPESAGGVPAEPASDSANEPIGPRPVGERAGVS